MEGGAKATGKSRVGAAPAEGGAKAAFMKTSQRSERGPGRGGVSLGRT